MRQLRELLTLHFEQHLSQRQLSRSLGVVRSTVERTLRRFALAKLTWPLPPELSDAQLEQLLYQGPAHRGTAKLVTRPNYAAAVIELARKGVTRQLLWREYRAVHSDGIGYSVYCQELATYQACHDLAYRNDHVPGVRGYYDFAGTKLAYWVDVYAVKRIFSSPPSVIQRQFSRMRMRMKKPVVGWTGKRDPSLLLVACQRF